MFRKGLWSLAAVLLALPACVVRLDSVQRVDGSGTLVSETRPLSGVERIVISGQGDAEVVVGAEESIVIEAEDNIVPLITTEISGGTLIVGTERNTNIRPTEPIRYLITVSTIEGVEVTGAGRVVIPDNGGGRLDLSVSGAGHIEAQGRADHLDVQISGAGNVDASGLEATAAEVRVSGAGNATVWAVDQLGVTITGLGNVSFWGDPKLEENITGLGKVSPLGGR